MVELPHVTPAELEGFVQQRLAAGPLSSFEAHLSRCDACARRLEQEARLELVAQQLARSERAAMAAHEAARARSQVRGTRVARGAALALAACLLAALFASSAFAPSGASDLPVAHAKPAGGLWGAADLPDGGTRLTAPTAVATWDGGRTRTSAQ